MNARVHTEQAARHWDGIDAFREQQQQEQERLDELEEVAEKEFQRAIALGDMEAVLGSNDQLGDYLDDYVYGFDGDNTILKALLFAAKNGHEGAQNLLRSVREGYAKHQAQTLLDEEEEENELGEYA